ncbi:MAG: alpha/beta hydrolase [Pseudomonadales bacterium]
MHSLLEKIIKTNGIKLHIVTQGKGPLVIFCHGFPGHWSHWRHQLAAVATAGFTGVAVDMRGYGESSRPSLLADYNMDQQVADMLGLLQALDAEKAIFVGQDFGAPLVWNMAIREPSCVVGVVGISVPFDHDYYGRSCLGHLAADELSEEALSSLLVASPVNPPSTGFNAIAEHQFFHAHYFQAEGLADKELGENAREFLSRIYWGLSANGSLGDWADYPSAGTQYLDVLPQAPGLPWPWMSEQDMDLIERAYLTTGSDSAFIGGLASYRVADINWHIGDKYAALNVEVPALFIAGENDPVMASVNDATLDRMKQRVPDLRGIKIIPDAGHFVQLENANLTSAAIVNFIAGL